MSARCSAQALAVMSALAGEPAAWRHGYDLAAETGLRPGTLYPVLVWLADQQLVAARWSGGEPRRHQYRLTAAGLAVAGIAVPGTVVPGAAPTGPAAPGARHRPASRRRLAVPRPVSGAGA
jgi:PadR family transcriptional regulator, regulatory protein PadR